MYKRNMANRVVHFEIEAQDLKREKKFYNDALCWKKEQIGDDKREYIIKKTGKQKDTGINGGIFPGKKKKELNAYSCVIGVEDIHKAMKDVKAAGGKVLSKKPDDIPHVGLYAKCED